MRWPAPFPGAVVSAARRPLGAPGRFEPGLWALVVCAMVADLAVTAYGLRRGYVEANPVARTVYGTLGFAGLGLLKGVTLAAGLVFRWAIPRRLRFLIPAAIATPWTLAVLASAATIATTTP